MSPYKKQITPGDWHFNNRDFTIRTNDFKGNDLMGDYRGCIIADLNPSHGNREHALDEVERNGHLLAAAKQMYQTLLLVRTLLERIPDSVIAKQEVENAILSAEAETYTNPRPDNYIKNSRR